MSTKYVLKDKKNNSKYYCNLLLLIFFVCLLVALFIDILCKIKFTFFSNAIDTIFIIEIVNEKNKFCIECFGYV